MERLNKNSMLVAAVPMSRGRPVHYENDEDNACCVIVGETVEAIHTPQQITKRVHEAALHGCHTSMRRAKRQYKDIIPIVAQITEDVRLHMLKWQWPHGRTPEIIAKPTRELIEFERSEADRLNADPTKGLWAPFAHRLRAYAMEYGLSPWADAGYKDKHEDRLFREVRDLIRRKKEGEAARLLQTAFFPPPPPPPPPPPKSPQSSKRKPKDEPGKRRDIKMEVIELAHTVPISNAETGERLSASGPRIDRRMLRRPVLPVRCFTRRRPTEPGGTILIDASGSMGDWEQVQQWCETAPFATVAYYAGYSRGGQLIVYAREGYRAPEIMPPIGRNNVIDGPALDWLMKQEGPRIMITDREFCGAHDSIAQRIRLANLENAGEIEVRDYSNKEDKK